MLVQEDEEVVTHAMWTRTVQIVDSGVSFCVEGFKNMKETYFHPEMVLDKVAAHKHTT